MTSQQLNLTLCVFHLVQHIWRISNENYQVHLYPELSQYIHADIQNLSACRDTFSTPTGWEDVHLSRQRCVLPTQVDVNGRAVPTGATTGSML